MPEKIPLGLKAFIYNLAIVLPLAVIFFGIPYSARAVDLVNPLGETYDPRVILGNIISGVLGLIGSVALILFVYGGILLMLSQGDTGKVKKGKDTMLWAAIGLAVVFSSYAITKFVIDKLTAAK